MKKESDKLEKRDIAYLFVLPVFTSLFMLTEHVLHFTHLVQIPFDDLIPFCEWFIFPYQLLDFAFAGSIIFFLLFDRTSYRRYSKYLAISCGLSMVMLILYPSFNTLRPETFTRDNIATDLVKMLYAIDMPRNVLPSTHVVGIFGLSPAFLKSDRKYPLWAKILAVFTSFIVSISTVFVKQHSIVDIFAAIPFCIVGYMLVFSRKALAKEKKALA